MAIHKGKPPANLAWHSSPNLAKPPSTTIHAPSPSPVDQQRGLQGRQCPSLRPCASMHLVSPGTPGLGTL